MSEPDSWKSRPDSKISSIHTRLSLRTRLGYAATKRAGRLQIGAEQGLLKKRPLLWRSRTLSSKSALKALENTRQEGFSAGLVVLATGLGKTWLSAFDSNRSEFRRVLFVAHREEILNQAIDNFRRVRPNASIGRMIASQRDISADLLFASVQTLGRIENLNGSRPRLLTISSSTNFITPRPRPIGG